MQGGPGDDSDDSESDWMYGSIRRYKHLLMFELEFAATCLEVCGDGAGACSVCVAGARPRAKGQQGDGAAATAGEILHMAFPEKLHSASKEDEGLRSGRDLAIKGGVFTHGLVKQIKSASDGQLIAVSEEQREGVKLYSIKNDETDMLQETTSVQSNITSPIVDIHQSTMVMSAVANQLEVYDLESMQISFRTRFEAEARQISSLRFPTQDLIVACDSQDGIVFMKDMRQSNGVQISKLDWCKNDFWKMATDGSVIILASARGQYLLSDVRNFTNVVSSGHLQVPTCSGKYLTVSLSPTSNAFSVSGYDHNVYIYEKDNAINPVFKHDGHGAKSIYREKRVTTHVWHPKEPNLLISASENESLHAWQFMQ